LTYHLRRNQQASNAATHHDLRFGYRGDADSDSALLDLPSRNVHAFVCLGMRTQRDLAFTRKTAHFVEIRVEPVEIHY
jgi:hypothetical protein